MYGGLRLHGAHDQGPHRGSTSTSPASIRWTGVINMSDAIGGVDVCARPHRRPQHRPPPGQAGTHNLKGKKALQFLRIRHGIGDGSDLGRISNQQQFLSSMIRKLQSGAVLSNPVHALRPGEHRRAAGEQKQLRAQRLALQPHPHGADRDGGEATSTTRTSCSCSTRRRTTQGEGIEGGAAHRPGEGALPGPEGQQGDQAHRQDASQGYRRRGEGGERPSKPTTAPTPGTSGSP